MLAFKSQQWVAIKFCAVSALNPYCVRFVSQDTVPGSKIPEVGVAGPTTWISCHWIGRLSIYYLGNKLPIEPQCYVARGIYRLYFRFDVE